MKIANTITVDSVDHEIRIDGVAFPFYVRDAPQVTSATMDFPLNAITIEILAENVHLITDKGVKFLDAQGDQSEWAKACVNQIVEERLSDTLAWLRGAGVDV